VKGTELKKLVEEYKMLKLKKSNHKKTLSRLEELEHMYYHETGQSLKSHLEGKI